MQMDRERGEGRGEGESMRDLGKRRRHGLGGRKDRLRLVLLFEIINILLLYEWTSGDWCAHVIVCVCVCIVQ